jgi:hypothetical protein
MKGKNIKAFGLRKLIFYKELTLSKELVLSRKNSPKEFLEVLVVLGN